MIPLHYLIAFAVLLLIWREIILVERPERNRMLVGFLALLAFQAFLIGTRFGYGVESLGRIQPLTASMLPPLAYLSFRERPALPAGLLHLIPLVAALAIPLFAIELLDGFLAVNNVAYAFALAMIGLKGSDGLGWAPIHRIPGLLVALWLIVALLFSSGIADIVIAADFWLTGGTHTRSIVGLAAICGLATVILASGLLAWRNSAGKASDNQNKAVNEATLAKIQALFEGEKIFLDPDLNLNRIARRLTLPAREVSRAINLATGNNVSQYVNQLRIEEACRILADPKASVTETIYASGFNTKSNFNREFVRVTGRTPSEWRNDQNPS